MECSCIRQTDLPGTSRLFADFTYHQDRVSQFYPWVTRGGAAFAEAAAQIDMPAERRAAIVQALAEQNPGNPLLDRLAKPGTVAVVTGQQVGFLSGPAYTIYKALTAYRLAERLTAAGIDAVPVFWLATEDHDFAEVNHAWVYNREHRPTRLECAADALANQPVGGVILNAFDWDQLTQGLSGLPFADEAIALARDAYRPGVTLGAAFGALVRKILDRYPMLHLDPLAPAIRKLAAPILGKAVAKAGVLKQRLLDRNRELAAAGYHAQVLVDDQTSLFFLLEGGRRLRIAGNEITADPENLSPNALLRPVVQDFILPTVAYVGGPAELAYLAQSQVLYEELLGRQPVALHRTGFTILDQRSHKLFNRYGLSLSDFYHGEAALSERIAAKLVPPGLSADIAKSRESIVSTIRTLTGQLEQFDPTLAKAAARSRRKIEHQIGKIEAKTARQILQRDEAARANAASLNGLLYPHKHLQERFYSILPLMAEHGPELIHSLADHVALDCPDHQLVVE